MQYITRNQTYAGRHKEEDPETKKYGQLPERSDVHVDNGCDGGAPSPHQVSPLRLRSHPHPFRDQITMEVAPCHRGMDVSKLQELPVSTRDTVAHCKEPLDIHVYKEMLDKENLYIELYQDAGNSITNFRIPLGVALAIACRLMPTLAETERYAAMTDEDIISHCSAAVEERMSAHANMGGRPFSSIDQQVERDVADMKKSRENYRHILQVVDKVECGLA